MFHEATPKNGALASNLQAELVFGLIDRAAKTDVNLGFA